MHLSCSMEIDKILEQLSLPLSPENFGSTTEDASDNLGVSHNSSEITCNSTNSSWMSDSSCGCHSPRFVSMSKSLLNFNNHCILPPLLCSASRTEMQVYRRRAVEKEQKRRKLRSKNLVAKVESILSLNDKTSKDEETKTKQCSVNVASAIPQDNQPMQCELDDSTGYCDEENAQVHHSDTSLCHIQSSCANEDDAYRLSLRNLLEKSTNLTENKCCIDNPLDDRHSQNIESLECDKNFDEASQNLQTVNETLEDSPLDNPHDSSLDSDLAREEGMRKALNATAETLVNSVLDAVRLELSASNRLNNNPPDVEKIEENYFDIPEESPLQSCSIHCPYYSPRSCKSITASPCKTTEHINKALYLLETELGHQYKLGVKIDSTRSCENTDPFSNENNLQTSLPHSLEMTDNDISIVETETSLLTPQASPCMQTTKVENNGSSECITIEKIDKTKTPQSPPLKSIPFEMKNDSVPRIRSRSFSIDNPSALLLSSRSIHTVSSEGDETRKSEVKRRLDMSDSDESLLSTPITEISLQSIQLNGKSTLPEYCRMLEDRHKQEMHQLQRLHQIQLEKYKQRFLSEMSPDEMSSYCIEERSLFQYEVSPTMHLTWCKLSALVKGHLTRMLLTSLPVQSTMQTIRDTSRTILSMRSEDNAFSTNMSAIQDATLMNRLFSQLKSAMFEFHSFFFEKSVKERMEIIARSKNAHAKSLVPKNTNSSKPRLSDATMKSLQRKRDIRKNKEEKRINHIGKKTQTERRRTDIKEVQSKISSIWKTGTNKKASRFDVNRKKSPSSSNPRRSVSIHA